MFIDIQSFFFHPLVYPDAYQFVCHLEQQIRHDRTENNGYQGCHELYPPN